MMLSETDLSIEALRSLVGEDYYESLEVLAKVRLANIRESRRYHDVLKSLSKEYVEERRAIITEKNFSRYQELRQDQVQATQSVMAKPPRTLEEHKKLEKARAEWAEKAQKSIEELGVDEGRIESLRESHQQKMDSAFFETIGKGKQAETLGEDSGSGDSDPESFPPHFWCFSEFDPPGSGRSWSNSSVGLMGADLRCSLRDCGEHSSQQATVRQSWLMGGAADRMGRLQATIDLHPMVFFSSMMVRDNSGWSGVDIRRTFRVFAQVYMPHESERFYCPFIDRLYLDERWRHGYRRVPFEYHEEARRLRSFDSSGEIEDLTAVEFTGSSLGDRTWRYTVIVPGTILERQTVLAVVGIEFYNRVWGDDCTVSSALNYEFLTPRISWDIVP